MWSCDESVIELHDKGTFLYDKTVFVCFFKT